MTTTFTRQSLLDAAKEVVTKMEAELTDYDQRVELFKEKIKHRWLLENRPRVKAVRDALTKQLATGKVITERDVPSLSRLLYTEPSSYDIGKGVGFVNQSTRRDFLARLIAYRGVVRLLETAEGDSLSVSQLKTLGLTKLGELFRIAANTEGALLENPLV